MNGSDQEKYFNGNVYYIIFTCVLSPFVQELTDYYILNYNNDVNDLHQNVYKQFNLHQMMGIKW
jgi:hypothetical protein